MNTDILKITKTIEIIKDSWVFQRALAKIIRFTMTTKTKTQYISI